MDERERLKKRFIELANRSYSSGLFLFTDFLGLDEQSVFSEAKAVFGNIPYKTFGGTEGAERIMVRFGDEEELSYSEPFPIVCIKAEPVSQKFAKKLTHRDFLGALMNLGIERSTLGDIPILDNVGYIFAKEDIAPFIMSELTRARHTDLKLSIVESLTRLSRRYSPSRATRRSRFFQRGSFTPTDVFARIPRTSRKEARGSACAAGEE